MSFEEDTELRDLVIETLDKKGVMGKIKAELRATVFMALEDCNFEKCKIPLRNESLQKFSETNEGKITISLVRDFLVTFNLDYTLAVFDPEVSCSNTLYTREDLESKLNIQPEGNQIASLLQTILQGIKCGKETKPKEKSLLGNEKILKPQLAEIKSSWLPETTTPLDTKQTFSDSGRLPDNNASDLVKDDNDEFFDDPIPQSPIKPLLFSFLGSSNATSVKKLPSEMTKAAAESANKTFVSKINTTLPEKHEPSAGLSSLQDLPGLGIPNKAKTSPLYEDDFQSSVSSEFEKSRAKEPNVDDKEQLPETEDRDGSSEEDIEEDISVSADDLLNSSLSQEEK